MEFAHRDALYMAPRNRHITPQAYWHYADASPPSDTYPRTSADTAQHSYHDCHIQMSFHIACIQSATLYRIAAYGTPGTVLAVALAGLRSQAQPHNRHIQPPHPASLAVLLLWHRMHSPCMFSIVSSPPCAFGTMWSTWVDGCLHTTHNGSRCSTSNRSRFHRAEQYPRRAALGRRVSASRCGWR